MIWTLELASYLDDAPWPATKEELIDYAVRTGAPLEVLQNLEELEDSDEPYESMEEIWPDYPTDEDFFFEDDILGSVTSSREVALDYEIQGQY